MRIQRHGLPDNVQALTDMIHQVADNDVSKTDKQPDAAQKPKQP